MISITGTDMSVELISLSPITYTWAAGYLDPRNIKLKIYTSDLLDGSEELKITLLNWKSFRSVNGG